MRKSKKDMPLKSRLPVYTFFAVFTAIVAVGSFILPVFLNVLQKRYYELQGDVNYRQAKSMAQFIEKRISEGVDKEKIIEEFQKMIKDTQFDRGYVCVIDQETTNVLSHPMTEAIGTSISSKHALYDAQYEHSNMVKWEELIKVGKSGGGMLYYENELSPEIVYFQSIPKVHWTVSSHENSVRMSQEISKIKSSLTIASVVFGLLLAFPISFAARRVGRRYERQIEEKNLQIQEEQQKSEKLLLNVLPSSVAERMKKGEKMIADHFAEVSVLFCDLANFTPLSLKISPEELVKLLNKIFSRFDKICQKQGVEKIKTIGDAYMAVCGIPQATKNSTEPLALVALEMLEIIKKIDLDLDIRIGLHYGEVVAGVIGTTKFSYDLWGDTVNTASRLESHGKVGKIHCSEAIYQALKDKFEFQDNGLVEIKGKGQMHTYFLRRPSESQCL
jgi:class 3 adenylate cyclase